MKPATSLCGKRRLVGIRRCTNTSPPTASNIARQIKRRPVTMCIESLLHAPLRELPDAGQDTISSQTRQRSESLSEFLAETTVLWRAGCKVPGHALAGSVAPNRLLNARPLPLYLDVDRDVGKLPVDLLHSRDPHSFPR